jgi:hypothetical protein
MIAFSGIVIPSRARNVLFARNFDCLAARLRTA